MTWAVEIFGRSKSEEIGGQAMRLAATRSSSNQFRPRISLRGGPGTLDSSPANIHAAVEGSLKRLSTDRIDLYYQHRVDPNTPSRTSSAHWPSWSSRARSCNIGLSEAAPDTIRRARC